MSSRIEIFCIYARKDSEYLKELKVHLAPLERQGLIKIWNDIDISPGANWEVELYRHLHTAQIILLLISPDFMASDYCYDIEMERAMKRHARREVRVIPIILRPTHWQVQPIKELQALPKDAKPITLWENRDAAFLDVVQSIQRTIKDLNAQKDTLLLNRRTKAYTPNSYNKAKKRVEPPRYISDEPGEEDTLRNPFSDHVPMKSRSEGFRRQTSHSNETSTHLNQDKRGTEFADSPVLRARRGSSVNTPLPPIDVSLHKPFLRPSILAIAGATVVLAILISAAIFQRHEGLIPSYPGGEVYNVQVGGNLAGTWQKNITLTPTCTPKSSSKQSSIPTPTPTCTSRPNSTPTIVATPTTSP